MNWSKVHPGWKVQLVTCGLILPFYAAVYWPYFAIWQQPLAWPQMMSLIAMMVGLSITIDNNEPVSAWQRVTLCFAGLLATAIVVAACGLLEQVVGNPDLRWWGWAAWSVVAGFTAALGVFAVAHVHCPWSLYRAVPEVLSKRVS